MGEKEGFTDKWKKDGHAGRAHEREGEEQEANGERVVGEPAREFNAGTNRCTCMQHREVLSYRGWGMLACTQDGERTGGLEAGEMLGGGWEWFRCGYEEGRVGVLGQECLLSRVVRHRVVKEGWKGNWGQDVVKHEDDWQRLAKRWAGRGIAEDEMGKKSHGHESWRGQGCEIGHDDRGARWRRDARFSFYSSAHTCELWLSRLES